MRSMFSQNALRQQPQRSSDMTLNLPGQPRSSAATFIVIGLKVTGSVPGRLVYFRSFELFIQLRIKLMRPEHRLFGINCRLNFRYCQEVQSSPTRWHDNRWLVSQMYSEWHIFRTDHQPSTAYLAAGGLPHTSNRYIVASQYQFKHSILAGQQTRLESVNFVIVVIH